MTTRRRGWLLVALWLAASASAPAFGPRDLEPRPPYQENPTAMFPGDVRRSGIEKLPKPPPPEYAWWYLKAEREAARAGKPDPWFYHRHRKIGGLHPQPGFRLGEFWTRHGEPYPEGQGPRRLHRLRKGSWPAGRLSPDPGFRTADPDYRFHPWNPRSDVALEGRRPAWADPEPPFSTEPRRTAAPRPARGSREELARRGRALLERSPGPGHRACTHCHAGTGNLEGAFFRYPAYDSHRGRIISLEERVNMCRTIHQGCGELPPGSRDLTSLLLRLRQLGGRE